MRTLVAVFVFGGLVVAVVAMGLVMAMSAFAADDPGAFEGRSAEDEGIDP